MKAGSTQRFNCEECSSEFDVTYEPKAKGKPKEIEAIATSAVEYCPFCKALLPLDEEEEDSDDE